MNAIGIMQGRLSPQGPRPQTFPSAWQQEFAAARACGFERIEWLLTAGSLSGNPLLTDPAQILECSLATNVAVKSVCADCYLEQPIVRVSAGARDAGIGLLDRVIAQCAVAGIETIVLPILEMNRCDETEFDSLLDSLAPQLTRARTRDVQIAFESDLPAAVLRRVIARRGVEVGVCLDTGNAVAAGLDPEAEIAVLADLLFEVHVKDRRRGGPSVMLGQGDANYIAIGEALRTIAYRRSLILETPRGDDPVASASRQLSLVREQLGPAAVAPR